LQSWTERRVRVMTNKIWAARTIFVEVPSHMAPEAVVRVAVVLNERLAGLTLREIRATLSDRLRDAAPAPDANQLLNIFIQEADELFDVPSAAAGAGSDDLGSAQHAAGQAEFATKERLKSLIHVIERRDLLDQ